MIRNVLDQALANIIGKVAELPVTVKGYTDDVVQQMDERHRALSQKLEDAISKADAALQKLDSLTGACSKVQTTCFRGCNLNCVKLQ